MATQKTKYLKIFISSIYISIVCVVSLSLAKDEEIILIHFRGRTGDILKVEHRTENGDIIEKRANFFSPFKGMVALQSFQYPVSDLLSSEDVKSCCPVIHCWFCFKIDVVIGTYKFDRKQNSFTFDSLNTMEDGRLKPLVKVPFDPSHSVLRPRTRSYFFAVVQSNGGIEVQVLDEVKNEIWR